ncbi:hypothetical protein NP493_265g01038 [Ridgeia piscesae]|uniref:Uncharacterized protein n=1 Tax=Ridgeia piscesae TaxID=27915 RepID=A0AAD9NXY1_RIDPI|nr:hypothetical protein NP493_265g01038 [Ridgeia piscesae]
MVLYANVNPMSAAWAVGCICHLADLCVKAGMKQWSLPVDDLLIDTWFHFDRSAKRQMHFQEFQEFANIKELEIFKHCQTRWLSPLRVI